MLINGATQVIPHAFDLHVGFIHPQPTFLEYPLDISAAELIEQVVTDSLEDQCIGVLLAGEIECHGKELY